jgi:hypothetical protein
MRYIRLKVDNAGKTHFEQAALDLNEADYRPPAPLLFVSHTYRADGLQFVRLPAGWVGESIHPPKHQFLICLKGHLEVTASDGEKRTFGPGAQAARAGRATSPRQILRHPRAKG